MKTTELSNMIEECLYDTMLSQGEVYPLANYTHEIKDCEFSHGFEASPAEILTAYRNAGERAVDAWQSNAEETFQAEQKSNPPFPAYPTQDDLVRHMQQYERMRPSCVRLEQLAKIASDAALPSDV